MWEASGPVQELPSGAVAAPWRVSVIIRLLEEPRRGHRVENAVPLFAVPRKRLFGGRVNRYQPRLAELTATNSQQPLLQIDVLPLERDRFTDPYAGDGEQSEQAVVGPSPHTVHRWQLLGSFQQLLDLLLAIEVRSATSRSIWQQTVRWYLGTRIGGAAVSRETTHEAEPAGPLRRLTCRTLHGPAQCELIGDVGRALPFEKGDEIEQSWSGNAQLESQTT